MNGSQTETFLSPPLLWLGVGERALRHGDIVAHVRQLDRGAMALWVDCGPAIELQSARRRRTAEKGERELPVGAVLRPRDDHARIVTGQHLRLAIEIGRAGQERAERRLV